MYFKIKRIGQNLIVIEDSKVPYTITLPKDYNFDKIFSLAYRANNQIKVAETLLLKELKKFEKPKVVDSKIIETRIEKKKLEKKIKEIQQIEISSLPITITPEWQKVLDSQEDNQHIKNFLIWLSLNELPQIREGFLEQFSAKSPYITPNGMIVACRQVWRNTTEGSDVLYNFIQSSYHRIKGQKKGVNNYNIIDLGNKEYKLTKDLNVTYLTAGNLGELYKIYPKPKEEVTYYSNYAKDNFNYKENWKIGEIAEVKIKNENSNFCDSGQLHIRLDPNDTKNGGYGDTNVIVLINPKDLTNISYSWKFCTSRMMILCEIDQKDISSTFVSDFGKFDIDLVNYDMKNVQKIANKDTITSLKKGLKSYKTIKSATEEVLDNSSKHLFSDLYNKIIENRISLITK